MRPIARHNLRAPLCETREYERALPLYGQAEATHSRHGVIVGALWARNGAARAEMLLGMLRRGSTAPRRSDRRGARLRSGSAGLMGLRLLSLVSFYQGNLARAVDAAQAGISLARSAGSPEDVIDCELLLYRASGNAGDVCAMNKLRELTAALDGEGTATSAQKRASILPNAWPRRPSTKRPDCSWRLSGFRLQ